MKYSRGVQSGGGSYRGLQRLNGPEIADLEWLREGNAVRDDMDLDPVLHEVWSRIVASKGSHDPEEKDKIVRKVINTLTRVQ